MYDILPYSFKKAKLLDVKIYKSSNPKKKIDVYKNGNKIASIGNIGYSDYPTYLKNDGPIHAKERRRLYHLRHKNDTGLTGYYALNILW